MQLWQDEALVLGARRHGEAAALVSVLTAFHGRQVGVMRGGRRLGPLLQPGALLRVAARARLEQHMPSLTAEPARPFHPPQDRLRLEGLAALCAMAAFALPEREPVPELFALATALGTAEPFEWAERYAGWELLLLAQLGYGLDLSECAVTGAREGLAYVSPRTGRAVTAAGAGAWRDQLLPLPVCLGGVGNGDAHEALRTTGHFLTARLLPALGKSALPPARARLVSLLDARAMS